MDKPQRPDEPGLVPKAGGGYLGLECAAALVGWGVGEPERGVVVL